MILAFYPALALMASNFGHAAMTDVLRPLIFSIVVGALLFLLTRVIVHNWNQSALISTLLVLVFFTFGHLYDALKNVTIITLEIGRLRYLLPVVIIVVTGLILLIRWRRKRLRLINQFLTYAAIALVIFSLGQLVVLKVSAQKIVSKSDQLQTGVENTAMVNSGNTPDVYYIILDMYTRSDYLLNEYGYDNSDFLAELEDLGFYVARCSQNNYRTTALSMASSLNYEYLDELAPEIIEKNLSWVNFKPYIDHSRVRLFFQDLGYQFISAQTSYDWVDIKDADIYIQRRTVAGSNLELTAFETLFLRSTLLRPVMGLNFFAKMKGVVTYERSRYENILFTLDQMKKIPEYSGSKFTYIHLTVPHGPFVFTPEGDFFVTEDEKTGYVDNVKFINSQIIPVLEAIIEKSETPPIILLQADHGTTASYFSILNAYYLPGINDDVLYPTITPVNSFRLVMDNYFGTQLELLDDITYTWDYQDVYDFGIRENDCQD